MIYQHIFKQIVEIKQDTNVMGKVRELLFLLKNHGTFSDPHIL
jgi:hypothetical protein